MADSGRVVSQSPITPTQALGQRNNIRLLLFSICIWIFMGQAFAGVTASMSGTVTDPSGAVVVGAMVTATNTDTGIAQRQPTNGQGFYSFASLPLGHYELQVAQSGFQSIRRTGLVLDVNSALVIDVALKVGDVQQ